MEDYFRYLIHNNSTIKDALIALNSLSHDTLVLFVIDEQERMVGTLTDGDIRRYLITDGKISDTIDKPMNRQFHSIHSLTNLFLIKEYKEKALSLIPYLDENGCIIRILNLRQKKSFLPIDAVLMAGGKGERLRPLTEKIPKPLLYVGNKAIIDYNVDSLISYGVEHISVTVNYLHAQIEEHFKGCRDGVQVKCVCEPKYLGTIGSIKFVESFKYDTVLVMNSDLFTNINYEDFYLHFKENDVDMQLFRIPYLYLMEFLNWTDETFVV